MSAGDDDGRAIPFIAWEKDEFRVTNEAQEFLSKVEAPVQVISVAGMYRTGKSFLLNHILIQKQKAFEVGPTVEACTKGLWVWNKVIERPKKGGGTCRLIVIDTEGIGSTQASEKHDATLFSLALLVSSYFIYNSVGCIDERALNSLSLVANLTEHIHVSGKGGRHESGADFSLHFPSFMWLVRDFSLQLLSPEGKPISAKEYLELALKETPGFNEQIESKNRIRRMISSFFPTRDCCTLVRPLTDEEALQRLATTPEDHLRPEFREQVAILQNRIYSSAPSKKVGRIDVDGRSLCDLAHAYVCSINGGAVPAILDAYSQVCEGKLMRAVQEAVEGFERELSEQVGGADASQGEGYAVQTVKRLEVEARLVFEGQVVDGDVDKHRKVLEERLEEAGGRMLADFRSRAKSWAADLLSELYRPIEEKALAGGYESFDQYEAERKKARLECMDKGVSAENIAVFMEGRMSEFASRMDARRRAEAQEREEVLREESASARKEWEAGKQRMELEAHSLEERLAFAVSRGEELEGRERRAKEEMSKETARLSKLLEDEVEKRREAERESDKLKSELSGAQREKERERRERERERERRAEREADLLRLLDETKANAQEARSEREAERGEREREREREERGRREQAERFNALEGKYEASVEEARACRETIENLQKGIGRGSDETKAEIGRLQNLITVGREEIGRLEGQVESMRRESKEEAERCEATRGRLEESEMRRRDAEHKLEGLTSKLEEAERANARFVKDKEAIDQGASTSAQEARDRLEALQKEKSALISTWELQQAQSEGRIAALEAQVEGLRREAEGAVDALKEARVAQEQGMSVSEREWSERVMNLEANQRRQLSELREANEKGLELAQESMKQERSMYEDRISGLQSSLKDVRESVDEKEAKMDEMSSQIREYEAALDELERDNQVQTAKIRVECEKRLQDAESKLVRTEADLLKELGVARSKAEGVQQQLSDLREVYREEKEEAAKRHGEEKSSLEREIKELKEEERRSREEMAKQVKDAPISGAASDAVSGLSRVLTLKTAELEAFQASSVETMMQLNRLIETKDIENEQLRRYWKIFTLHYLRCQCRYCGRSVMCVMADEHITGCMRQRGIGGWHEIATTPPGAGLRVEVGGSMMENIGGKSKRVYLLKVQTASKEWEVSRRYSDFTKLQARLKSTLPKVKLPIQSSMSNQANAVFQNEAQVIEKRRACIADYFDQALQISVVCEHEEIRAFLELED